MCEGIAGILLPVGPYYSIARPCSGNPRARLVGRGPKALVRGRSAERSEPPARSGCAKRRTHPPHRRRVELNAVGCDRKVVVICFTPSPVYRAVSLGIGDVTVHGPSGNRSIFRPEGSVNTRDAGPKTWTPSARFPVVIRRRGRERSFKSPIASGIMVDDLVVERFHGPFGSQTVQTGLVPPLPSTPATYRRGGVRRPGTGRSIRIVRAGRKIGVCGHAGQLEQTAQGRAGFYRASVGRR